MVKVPSRAALAKAIGQLERDLKVATAGGIVGGTLARSATARSAALSGAARVSPYALAIDALIREEESLLGRGVIGLGESAAMLATGVEARARREGLPIAGRPAVAPKKRPKSKFNKAVSAGMKAVKASTSYGKKGSITNAKKAFAQVTKTASRIKKGAKVAKRGVARKIGLAVKKVLK
jgi:hypothetical protein